MKPPARAGNRSLFGAPLWVSGFRPFFLLGTSYGLFTTGAWLAAYASAWSVPGTMAPNLWHGHEMVFGFATAIICGLLLTALPSWGGMRELAGGELALLVGTWLAGRTAIGVAPMLSSAAVGAVDVSSLLLLFAFLLPALLKARPKKFLVLLPVVLALCATNLWFHVASARGLTSEAAVALDAAVAVIAVLFSLVGGFMTPVFTRNALRELGESDRVWRNQAIERFAHASVVAFALAVAFRAEPLVTAAVSVCAFVAHALRLAGWRGWAARRVPLVLAMHLAYAWLVIAFALAAAAAFGVAARAWVHAVTVGAVGMMMLSLMPRVSLRHTGRPLILSPIVVGTYPAMFAATLLRLGVATLGWGGWAIITSVVLWFICFTVYLAVYGPMLVRPSLPRGARP
ncbi:MAG TPA: NnrS family protein [Casimicrobiaceae bacterium]|nr:NnrS family protein [Casimicrobiaceae bacterium]